MKRRTILAASGGAMAAGSIGTLGYSRLYGARVSSATDAALSPGEEGTLTITWEGVRSISYENRPDSGEVDIAIDDVVLSPPPDEIAASFPPVYLWESTTTVEMDIPVSVTAGARPGDYRLVLSAGGPADSLYHFLENETSQAFGRESDFTYPSHELTVTVIDA